MSIDVLQIQTIDGDIVASIARPLSAGPIEQAFRDLFGNEVLVPGSVRVGFANNFGIDGSGDVYFDTTGNVPTTDMADLWVDPVEMTFTFRSGSDR